MESLERDSTRERGKKRQTARLRDVIFKGPLMKWLISKKVRAVNTSSATTETADKRNRVAARGKEEAAEKARAARRRCNVESSQSDSTCVLPTR